MVGDTIKAPLMRSAGKELALDHVAVCIGAPRPIAGSLTAPTHADAAERCALTNSYHVLRRGPLMRWLVLS